LDSEIAVQRSLLARHEGFWLAGEIMVSLLFSVSAAPARGRSHAAISEAPAQRLV
jgi:hypothetical protein